MSGPPHAKGNTPPRSGLGTGEPTTKTGIRVVREILRETVHVSGILFKIMIPVVIMVKVLTAHALPVELRIAQKAGAPVIAMVMGISHGRGLPPGKDKDLHPQQAATLTRLPSTWRRPSAKRRIACG